MNNVEVWNDVSGYEGLYKVSNKGRVKSLDRKVWNGKVFYNKKGRILKNTKTTTGYWKVELIDSDGKRKSLRVHRLVAIAFIPRERDKKLINHIDGNRLNNDVNNLEWCDQSENMKHAYEIGLMDSNFTKYKDEILNEYISDKKTNVRLLARKYGCSDSHLRNYFKEKGIEIRDLSHVKDVYEIDKKKMVMYFEEGLSNKEIAKIFNTNNGLIATYRYKNKKGELKI